MTDYLTVAEILTIHADQIVRYGGVDGIRDPGQLEAALFRPQTGYYEDVIAEAAALWESLSQNHPFIDENKRVSFAATITFLAINGIEIRANSEETFEFIMDLYESGAFDFEKLEAWLRSTATE